MSVLWTSLILFCSITFGVQAEACCPCCPCCPCGTKNPNELASDILEWYEVKLNQITSGKTFDEILQEIDDRTVVKMIDFNCPSEKKPKALRCEYLAASKDLLIDMTAAYLSSSEIRAKNGTEKQDFIMGIYIDLVNVGMEKLQKANIDLKNYYASFLKKDERLTQLSIRWHNIDIIDSSKNENEKIELKFEKAHTEINSMKEKLTNEMKMNEELIVQMEVAQPCLKESWNVESLLKLAAAYEAYLLGHGIELPQSFSDRMDRIDNRLRNFKTEMKFNDNREKKFTYIKSMKYYI